MENWKLMTNRMGWGYLNAAWTRICCRLTLACVLVMDICRPVVNAREEEKTRKSILGECFDYFIEVLSFWRLSFYICMKWPLCIWSDIIPYEVTCTIYVDEVLVWSPFSCHHNQNDLIQIAYIHSARIAPNTFTAQITCIS